MSGETNLSKLLANMEPVLLEEAFVFVSVGGEIPCKVEQIHAMFREKEGITLILKKHIADYLQLSYTLVTSCITLNVHSALEAVGLTAAFSRALAENDISCNVVAGYYHDHIFVQNKKAKAAMHVLENLSKTKQDETLG